MANNKDVISGPSNLIIVQSRAIVFNSNNELLLVSRDNKRWSTPGGTVNKHEDLEGLAAKEVYEETGLKVSVKNLAYFLQEQWRADKGFWYFNEHISYPFNALCFVFCYHCEILGDEELASHWEDLDHNVIKYKKFFTEAEFKTLAKEKKLVQDELLNFSFQDITQLKSTRFFI